MPDNSAGHRAARELAYEDVDDLIFHTDHEWFASDR